MNAKKIVGKVNETERDEIKRLFERKNGLFELFKIINPDNTNLYNKLVDDMGKTSIEFQRWWDEKSEKYQWESVSNLSWEIDFDDCNIYLRENREL